MAPPKNTTKKPDYLTGADNIFIALEDEHHNMNVSSIYTFAKRMDPDVVRNQLIKFAEHTPRCKSIVVRTNALFDRPKWVDLEGGFNIDDQFEVVTLPKPGNKQQLMEDVAQKFTRKFDFSKPVWAAVFYDGLEDGTSCLFLNAHHCMADGQGFVRNLLSYVASIDPTKDRAALQYSAGHVVSSAKAINGTAPPAAEPDQVPMSVTESAAQCPATPQKEAPLPPTSQAPKPKKNIGTLVLTHFYLTFLFIYGTLIYILNGTKLMFLSPTSTRSFARTKKTAKKQLGWANAIQLTEVKKVKNSLGITVNDVLITMLSAAIERFLTERKALKETEGGVWGTGLGGSGFWFMIPTSLRKPEDWSVSNRSSGYMLQMPISKGAHIPAVRKVNKRMGSKKRNPEPLWNFWGFGYLFAYPNLIPTWMKTLASKPLHSVVSNVPGPNEPIPWGGEPIQEIISFIPQAYPNSLGCTIYSYRGKVSVSVMMDHDEEDNVYATGSAQRIADLFEQCFEELKSEVAGLKKAEGGVGKIKEL
ncbi:hypothetical protein HDV05_002554 [Chytridiales sp. JEL 0842]|nr:hypothetical protein HDV05_002554 [Chytridiales sp. JEL 0842]